QRLVVGSPGDPASPLNSPWGLAMAPSGDGDFGGDLLVGNFGNGWINAFDPNTGAFLGSLSGPAGNPIAISGLWALTFGNGGKGGDAGTLFFTAGSNGQADGLFGSLQTAFETPLAGAGANFAATEGAAFSGAVATINDAAAGALPSSFTATINWGDGGSSAGTVVADQSGGFDVVGSHTYTEEATAASQVTVSDAASHTITIAAQGAVADAPLSGAALPVAPAQGVNVSNAALATFTDPGGAEPVANYSATIDWGDGTSATGGAIAASGGTFTVTGSHTYAAAGFHTIAIAIKDEGGATLNLTTSTGTGYLQLNLVSDQPGAALVQDPNLLNPWGLAFSATGPFWVADNGADSATIYGGDAAESPFGKSPLTVSVPDGAPTGQVFNGTSDFVIGTGAHSGPAAFIFASQNGAIDAWSGKLSPIIQALSVVTTPNAVYKGLALGANAGANFLYATDFHDGRVDVFDKNFQPVTLGTGAFTGAFADPNIPAGFAPFGIEDLGGKLYVTYAKQDAAKHADVAGFGNGFVDVFDTAGNLLQRLIVGSPGDPASPLNSPWGLALAPANFGDVSGELLVGNFGDGHINAFDPTSGAFVGSLANPSGQPVVISGLWSLVFGNGGNAGDTNTLFFTAGTNGQQDGTFGDLVSAQNNPLAGVGGKLAASEGAALNGTLATFADTAVGAKAGDFNSTIVWGDGSSSAGAIAADGTGGFLVTGSHTYAEEGNDLAQVVITDAAAHTVTLNAGAAVADAALTAAGVTLQAARGAANTNVTVATFSDAGGAEAAANYTATIDWGDGGPATPGTISVAGGALQVQGSHAYSLPGRHTISVSIKDEGGATATATSSAVVGSADERFIEDVFRGLLGRDVDNLGLAGLTGLLSQGSSHAQLVNIVTSSPEFHADEVQGLFQLFLHRPAEPAAVNFFGDLLAHGDTTEQVEAIIASSPEYFQVRGGGTRDGFLDAVYADALHRAVEPGGRSFWDAQGGDDVVFRAIVAEGVFGSDEFLRDLVGAPGPRDDNPFHDFLLDGFFPAFLGRDPDPGGLTFFVTQLKAGTSDEQVLAEIMGSDEFTTRV
ncbi:MAG TPA: TIGR03118 family protein, partial [Pirellulales bacterium]|nr:TIGR03118 family protein [Pirellulales bacterium]